MRLLILTVFLGVLWYLLSGHTESLIIGFAVVSLAIVLLVTTRMRIADEEGFPFQITLRAITYTYWLGVQILLSSLAVAKVVLSPQRRFSPRMITLPTVQGTDLGRCIYANSITATPGTITVNVYADRVVVHALTKEAADDLVKGEMDRRVKSVVEGTI